MKLHDSYTGGAGDYFLSGLVSVRDMVPVSPRASEVSLSFSRGLSGPYEKMVDNAVRAAGAMERSKAFAAIVQQIVQSEDPIKDVTSVGRSLLISGRHGRILDSISFLSRLPDKLLERVADNVAEHLPTDGNDGNFRYALVRALGCCGNKHYVHKFEKSPDPVVREAVAEAFDDIGDKESITALKAMSENDESEFVRAVAADLLSDRDT